MGCTDKRGGKKENVNPKQEAAGAVENGNKEPRTVRGLPWLMEVEGHSKKIGRRWKRGGFLNKKKTTPRKRGATYKEGSVQKRQGE